MLGSGRDAKVLLVQCEIVAVHGRAVVTATGIIEKEDIG